ncbi:YncE family protein [Rubrobacter tropicus]|uniref:YncE family protein n=1 Tax=Rubrobacter tropicus TaxID=2653851 RepID=A0A6G8QAS9_9ACTN|nr:YncE family protein [Rubrobacter tropicus]QIN83571.1 YncE family protein [Rubrobacter tropicus]
MKTKPLVGFLWFALLAALMLAGCGTGGDTTQRKPPPAPEPAEAPPLEEEPAGRVVGVGPAPEGIAADPETGLVAVALRNPNELALVDGESGEISKRIGLPESARHLDISAPGGPVLVPAEGSDSLVQVGLPDGEISDETSVGDFPHAAAAAPSGRIFVVNEMASTASIIEDGRELETIKTSFKPGGVAVTDDGLVGIIGVRGLTLEVFEADTLESLGRIGAGEGPTHVRAGPGDRFYVTDTRGDAVLIYGARPEPVRLGRVPLPGSPYGIAIDPRRDQLWVTLTAEQSVVQFALEGDSLREIARHPTVRQPNTVAVDPASGRVFVTGKTGGQLQILEPR